MNIVKIVVPETHRYREFYQEPQGGLASSNHEPSDVDKGGFLEVTSRNCLRLTKVTEKTRRLSSIFVVKRSDSQLK